MEDSVASLAAGDDVKPYRIHVSSKYLELTKKKLELTRLPHEALLPKSQAWTQGTPKSVIEPLIDYWLENYQWRSQENHYNTTLPQFRIALTVPSSPAPIRIHFIHIKSPSTHAVPLLLVPSFPFTNLSLVSLFDPLAKPEDPNAQPYHLVVPSIPGLGFSDGFVAPGGKRTSLENTAHIFNSLMLKLGYEFYIASATGSGSASPAKIDYQIPRILASGYGENCLGIHLIDPPIQAPTLAMSPMSWAKFTIAKFFHAPIFGYTEADWANQPSFRSLLGSRGSLTPHPDDLEAAAPPTPDASSPLISRRPQRTLSSSGSLYGATGLLGLREPNTMAYALCDSPVGLLSLVLNGLRRISPDHALTRTQIIDITQLAWLPGPEGTMRYWSRAEAEVGRKSQWSRTPTAVTVFVDNDMYHCPSWAQTRHQVIWTKRQPGRAGLVAWERGDAVVEGIRGLTAEVVKRDPRILARHLEQVLVADTITEENACEAAVPVDEDAPLGPESPDTVILSPAI